MIKRGKAEKWAARSARLSTALRENLRRRKAQARGRAGGGSPSGDIADDDQAETVAPDFRRILGTKSGEGSGQ